MLYSFWGCGHIGVTILRCIVLGGVVTIGDFWIEQLCNNPY